MSVKTRDLGMTPLDDLFSTDESRADSRLEKVVTLNPAEISDFPNHPFKVRQDDDMAEMVESIRKYGVLVPALVRPKEDGGYEMVAGHRRKFAAALADVAEIPCIVRNLTDDEATIVMVDSNLQREKILPSEKAFAYKMKLEAMKRQAGRPSKENSVPLGQNFEGKTSRELLAAKSPDSNIIPIQRIWKDGIFQVGNRFSKTYQFSDINYLVASREDKEAMFLAYSELLNSLDSGATTKITINNQRLNKANFEQSILMPMRGDSRDVYRKEYNQMLLDKATGANGIMQEKYITISVAKKDIEEARTYFSRVGADLISHFAALGSKCTELDAGEKLRVLHDFYRQGEESAFHFDPQDMMKKGHDFKDYICPDSMEKNSDYLKLGEKYCRVLFLKDYASYIKDSMVGHSDISTTSNIYTHLNFTSKVASANAILGVYPSA